MGRLISRQAQETVERALAEMIPALPAIIETDAAMAEAARRRGDPTDLADRERLTRLLEAAQAVMEGGIGWRIVPEVKTWHQYAVWLAANFRKAMQDANPGLVLRLSNNGPQTRFLVAVIPLISGETPKGDAVARWLQREEKAGNTTKASVIR
jgi:hypothetical protein